MMKEAIVFGNTVLSEDEQRIAAMKKALAEISAIFARDEVDDLGRGIILIELVRKLEKPNGLTQEKSEVIQRTIDYAVRQDIVPPMHATSATR